MRVKDGVLRKGMKVRMMDTGASHQADRVGVLTPKIVDVPELGLGEVGFITAPIKTVADCQVGIPSMMTNRVRRHYRGLSCVPVVFCGLFPTVLLEKRSTTPASISSRSSAALGFASLWFSGFLHPEIIQEGWSVSLI